MEITVSFDAIAAMGVAMGVCFVFPFGFVIYNRKHMQLSAVISGVIGYIICAFFISGAVVDSFVYKISNPVISAFLSALGYALAVLVGSGILLKYLGNKGHNVGAALSYGLGFASFNLVLMHGAELFSTISLATAINNNGFELVSTTVEDPESLSNLIYEIANKSTLVHYLGAAELACYFLLTVAAAVLLWYAIGKNDMICAAVAFFAELIVMFMINYCSLGGVGIIVTEVIYITCSLAAAVYAYSVFKRYGDGVKYMADPVSRF